jgi:hypothetical protein
MTKTRHSRRVGARQASQSSPRLAGVAMEPPRLIAIDLVVRSRRSLARLVPALPRAYQPLGQNGQAVAGLIVLNGWPARDVETALRRLLGRLEPLRGQAKREWVSAYRRVFDIGVQAGGERPPFEELRITPNTLGRVAALGVQLHVTVYPPEPAASEVARRSRSHGVATSGGFKKSVGRRTGAV